jgi:acetyl esterase
MTLHPFFTAALAKSAGGPRLSSGTPADARALVTAGRPALGTGPDLARVEDVHVPGRSGPIGARVLVPEGPVAGLVVFVHGGGWVVGAPDDFDTLARTLAQRSGCVVLLPDYRLAPEHVFPSALEDVEDVLLWAAAGPEALGGPASTLVVGGDSAGANLATVAARRLAERVDLALQFLVYPVTGSDFDTESYRDESDALPLSRQDMQWFFGHYAPEATWQDQDVAPVRSGSLETLPRTLVMTAEHDVLRSDGELYAAALTRAGVATTYTCYPGMAHGFLRLHHHIDVADQALDDLAAEIRAVVAETAVPHPHEEEPAR